MTDDYPLGADNDTDAIAEDAARRAYANWEPPPWTLAALVDLRPLHPWHNPYFPATPAGIVAGSDRSGLPATPKPHTTNPDPGRRSKWIHTMIQPSTTAP